MGMAVGVDYSLFYVKRAREERRARPQPLDAVEIAAETSGHSVLVSGIAVIVSMLGLFLAGDVVVHLAGRRLDHRRRRRRARFADRAAGAAGQARPRRSTGRGCRCCGGCAAQRPRAAAVAGAAAAVARPDPARTLVVAVLALGALALPALGLHLQSDSARIAAGLDRR